MPNRLSAQLMAVLVSAVVLLGAGVTFAPAVLAQDSGSDVPTPGPDGDIDCEEFDSRQEVEKVYNPDNDQYRLDSGDEDTIACESVQGSSTPEPTPTQTATPEETVTPEQQDTTDTEQSTETETTAEADVEQDSSVVEPNNGPENAVPLNFSGTVVEEVRKAAVTSYDNQTDIPSRFGPNDEDDWYSFEGEAGQAVRMWGFVGMGDDTAFLIGPDGQRLAEFGGYGDLRPTGLTVEKSGTYYIRLVNNSGISDLGNYSFHVQVAQGDEFEPNNDRNSATPITPEESVSTTLTPATETDWYVVHASDGATINANISSLPRLNPALKAPTSVDVFNSEGKRISEPQQLPSGDAVNETTEYVGSTNASVVADSLEEGTYYIRVTADDGYVTGFSGEGFGFAPYRLTVSGEGLEEVDGNVTPPVNGTQTGDGNVTPTASTVFTNQTTKGTTVTVESVTLSEGGFVAIHKTVNGSVGSVIGVSQYLEAGTHEDVTVTVFELPGAEFNRSELNKSQTLIAMPHFDANGNQVYEFVSSNGTLDGPYTQNGSAVIDSAFITVEEDDGEDGAVCEAGSSAEVLGENDEDDDGDGAIDEDDEDINDGPSNDDDDGDGAVDEDDECDDGDDGMKSIAEDDDDGDGAVDEDDEPDSGNSDDIDNDGDGAIDEDDEPDTDD